MKKVLFTIILFLVITIFTPLSSNALTAELESQQGNEKVFNIVVSPPRESKAIEVLFSVEGGTILDVKQLENVNYAYLGICDNERFFDGNNVCVDIVVTDENTTFSGSQVILQLIVDSEADDIIVNTNDGFHYITVNNEKIDEQGNVLEVYDLGDNDNENNLPIAEENSLPIPTPTPTTTNNLPLIILVGALVVLIGMFLVIVFYQSNENKKVSNS